MQLAKFYTEVMDFNMAYLIVCVVIAVILIAVIFYHLNVVNALKLGTQKLESERDSAFARIEEISKASQNLRSEKDELSKINANISEKNTQLLSEKTKAESERNSACERIEVISKDLEVLKNQNLKLINETSELKSQIASYETQKKSDAEKLKDFEAFATKVFESARTKFESSNKSQLDLILNPLKDDLNNFRKRVDELNTNGEKRSQKMEEQVKAVRDMGLKLSKDAENLTLALKGQNKIAGNWGEMILEKMLEACGLKEGENFVREDSHTVADVDSRKRLRPDVVVKLPNGKNFIIDSKVSLVPYLSYCNAQNESEKLAALKMFETSIKTHIKGLSEKSYENIEGLENPDFTMMFIPIEGAFLLAVSSIENILEYAYERKISIVSPSTMFATLRTVESIWNTERSNKNALEIATQGGKLYDKVQIFLTKFDKIESSIKSLSNTYDEARITLSQGKGNVLSSADKLRKLGAKTKRKNETNILEISEDD